MSKKPRNWLESGRHFLDKILDRETGQYDPTNIDLDRMFKKFSGVSAIAVSIVSGGGMAYLSYTYISDLKVQYWINMSISAAIVYVMYLVTDKYLKKAVTIWTVWLCLNFYMDLWSDIRKTVTKGAEPAYSLGSRFFQLVIWAGISVAIFMLCYADYIAVESIREPVADIIPKDTTRSLQAERAAIYAQTNPGITRVNEQVAKEQAKFDNAEKYVKGLRSNRVFIRMIEKGESPGWANDQLSAQVSKIKKKAQSEMDRLNEIADGLVRDQTLAVRQLSEEIEGFNTGVLGKNDRVGAKVSSLVLWIGFNLKLFHILINMLRTLYFFAMRRKKKDQDVNKDGTIDEKDVEAYYQNLARQADERARLKGGTQTDF